MDASFMPNAHLEELNRRAGTEIMGWVISTEPYLEGIYKFKDSDQTARVHWQPTKDIGQAWEVINKIIDMGAASIAICSFDKKEDRWYAEVRVEEEVRPGRHSLYVSGLNSAPEAIVRACLKFMEWYSAQAR